MSKVTRDELVRVLGACIASAPDPIRQQLAETLQGYAVRYWRAYRSLTYNDTLLAAMLEAIEEATEAQIERDHAGVPIAPTESV